MIICDTREKNNGHILKYFEKYSVPYTVGKVDTGDYMDTDNPAVRVERKGSLGEMAHNLLSADRSRFYREIRRAREAGLALVVLCEQPGVKCLADVKKWKPKYGKATGRGLAEAIFRLEVAYGVPTFFTGKRSAGKRILEILTGGANEIQRDRSGP